MAYFRSRECRGLLLPCPCGCAGIRRDDADILAKPREQHPYARPVFPGAHGLWLVQQQPAPPLGYMTTRSSMGSWVFDVYAHCRDDGGRRPWLRTFDTLNAAVAWAMQNDSRAAGVLRQCAGVGAACRAQ